MELRSCKVLLVINLFAHRSFHEVITLSHFYYYFTCRSSDSFYFVLPNYDYISSKHLNIKLKKILVERKER